MCGLKAAAFILRFPPPNHAEMPASQHASPPCHTFYCASAYPSPNPEVNRLKRRWRCCTDDPNRLEREPSRSKLALQRVTRQPHPIARRPPRAAARTPDPASRPLPSARRLFRAALRLSQATRHPICSTRRPFSPARRVPLTRAPPKLFCAWLKLTGGRVIA